MPGHLILVPTPLGNLGDLTHRAVEALRVCDLVACEDTRRTGGLLGHLGIDKPLQRFDDHASLEAAERVAQALAAGRTVAYCSDAGLPGINDPGFELARLAREAGVRVTVLPGPSAVTLAVVASGLPSHAFSFWGYLPSRSEPRKAFLRKLGTQEETVVVFETPHRIVETLAELDAIAAGAGDRPGPGADQAARDLVPGHAGRGGRAAGRREPGRDGAGDGRRRRQAHRHRGRRRPWTGGAAAAGPCATWRRPGRAA